MTTPHRQFPNGNSILAVIVTLGLGACGAGLSQDGSDCPAGRTALDGVCVSEQIADYVSCVRAQGAQLGGEKSEKLSAEAGYLGIKAGGTAELSESLVKKYSASDEMMMAIVATCNQAAGLAATTAATPLPATPLPATPASPPVGQYAWRDVGTKQMNVVSGQCSADFTDTMPCDAGNVGKSVVVKVAPDPTVEYLPIDDARGHGQATSYEISNGDKTLRWTGRKSCGNDVERMSEVRVIECTKK